MPFLPKQFEDALAGPAPDWEGMIRAGRDAARGGQEGADREIFEWAAAARAEAARRAAAYFTFGYWEKPPAVDLRTVEDLLKTLAASPMRTPACAWAFPPLHALVLSPGAEVRDDLRERVVGALLGCDPGYLPGKRELFEPLKPGDLPALVRLGEAYFSGSRVPEDFTLAVHWHRKAAEQGFPEGQRNLGFMHVHGYGVRKDLAEAASLFRKAADQGDGRCQAHLACMRQYGYGVPQDAALAARWLAKAYADDKETLAKRLAELAYMGEKPADRLAPVREWLLRHPLAGAPKHADGALPRTLDAGLCLREAAEAMERDRDRIVEWMRALEDLRARMAALWGLVAMTEAARSMARGDAGSTAAMVADAWQELDRALMAGKKTGARDEAALESVERSLGEARHHMKSAGSSLPVESVPAGSKTLGEEWAKAFEACRSGMLTIVHKARGFVPAPPKGAVARVGELKYALLCELCGKEAGSAEVAVRSVPGAYPVEEECLVVNDWGEQVFALRKAVPALDLLEQGDVAGLHLLMRELVEGPDKYGLRCCCPDCGQILCRDHYRVDAVYDGGFYDRSDATCPKGHTREIDD